jgi:hypothetical protein
VRRDSERDDMKSFSDQLWARDVLASLPASQSERLA